MKTIIFENDHNLWPLTTKNPLTWPIFVASFIESCPPSTEISQQAR